MSVKDLGANGMESPIIDQVVERERREKVVAGSVNGPEELEILGSFEQAGFKVKSKAARVVLLSFARSVKVRDAVAVYVRENPDLLVD